MRFPTIHLNGTSGETLLKEYVEAYLAVKEAISKLSMVTVHGRDYYVQASASGDPASEAFAEHHARLRALENVKTHLKLIILNLQSQRDEQTCS